MTVRALRRGSIAASRAGGTPTTYTIFANTDDSGVNSANASYATARSGGTLSLSTGDGADVGQSTGFVIWQAQLLFNTATVVGTITAVTLHLYGSDKSGAAFTIEVRAHDPGPTITAADYVPGASLSGKTLLSSMATTAYTVGAYNQFAWTAGTFGNVNKSGLTGVLVCSSKTTAGTQPTAAEYISFNTTEHAGTTQDPKLVIEALV